MKSPIILNYLVYIVREKKLEVYLDALKKIPCKPCCPAAATRIKTMAFIVLGVGWIQSLLEQMCHCAFATKVFTQAMIY